MILLCTHFNHENAKSINAQQQYQYAAQQPPVRTAAKIDAQQPPQRNVSSTNPQQPPASTASAYNYYTSAQPNYYQQQAQVPQTAQAVNANDPNAAKTTQQSAPTQQQQYAYPQQPQQQQAYAYNNNANRY